MKSKKHRILASATVMSLVLTSTLTAATAKAAPGDVNKIQGENRYETAANVAKDNWKNGATDVIIASGEGYADSLSASVLAKKLNAPIILTTAAELNPNAKSALETLKPTNVYVIGGEASVSKEVRSGLKKDGYNVVELGGENRFETNLKVANHLVDKLGVKADNVMVVNGQDGFSDALSAAPVAAAKEQILLIVGKDASTANGAAEFVKKHNSKVTVIGTEGVVPAAVYTKLGATERVNGGSDRFATNIAIMKHFGLKVDKIYVTNATDGVKGYADALVGSALAGKDGAPLILVDTKDAKGTKNAIEYIKSIKNDKTEVQTLGGKSVMPEEIIDEIKVAINEEIEVAEKAVKAYEDAKIETVEEIAAAKALKTEAVKAVEAVKDVAKKESFQARIAKQDKLVADAEAKLIFKVESVSAINGIELQVKFNKEVDKGDAETIAHYIADGAAIVGTPVLQNDNKTVIITTTSAMDFDNVALVVEPIKLKEDTNKTTEKFAELFSYKDTVAPAVTKVEAKDGKAVITFAEKLIGVPGVSVNGANVTGTVAGKTLTISGLEDEKSYSVQVVGARDTTGNIANPIDLSFTVAKADAVVPQAVATTVKANKITLSFTNALGTGEKPAEVTVGTHDTIKLNGTTAVAGVFNTPVNGVTYSDDKKTVTIDAQAAGYLDGVNFLNTSIKISGAGLAKDSTVTTSLTTDTTAAKLVNSKVTADGKMTLTFDEEVKNPSTLNLKVVEKDDIYQSLPAKWDLVSTAYGTDEKGATLKNVLVLTLPADAKVGTKFKVEIAKDAVKDVYENGTDKFDVTFIKPATDATKPGEVITVYTQVVDGNSITLTFGATKDNKGVTSSALNAANYTLGGKALPSGTVLRYVDDKTKVEIVLPTGSIKTTGDYKLVMKNIQDTDGNTVKAIDSTKVLALIENVAPTATKITINSSSEAVVTFSENIEAIDLNNNSTKGEGVIVKVNGKVVTPIITLADNENTMKITGLDLKTTDSITIEFKDAEYADTNGNVIGDVVITK